MKFGVVIFPGSNCDRDMLHVFSHEMKQQTRAIWHKETRLDGFDTEDCIILPGGFSYGDALRTGAIARFSPIMDSIIDFAQRGGKVYGICNGFQILCESGLLPGVLLRNANQKFICKNTYIKTKTQNSPLTHKNKKDKPLHIPIAHAEGRFFANAFTLSTLEKNDQVLFTYCDENGNETDNTNPNGSLHSIAGICNDRRNVFGMMPHPERAAEAILGNIDGRILFESLIQPMKM